MKFPRGTTNKARVKSIEWIKSNFPNEHELIVPGLPEYDDRSDSWRISLNAKNSRLKNIGEIKLSRDLEQIVDYTRLNIVNQRLRKLEIETPKNNKVKSKKKLFYPAPIPNKVILGDSNQVLEDFPPDTAQLVVTSPPYYNAKPEYSEYVDYQEYLDFLRKIFVRCHNILSEGRFIVINVSPVLVKRTSRKTASKRIPIPFDIHGILDKIGFDFIDDIQWVKPEGAGWNIGRGRRFAADRKPLQYKPVPVTENVMVYRKRTDKLIDWNLRYHHDLNLIDESRINGEYDRTNIWHIHPSHSKVHPATFPEDLVERIIRYYSFKDDLVLDPFAGTGTVGRVAHKMGRRFMLVENNEQYYQHMKEDLVDTIASDTRVDYDIHEENKDTI